MLRKSTPKNSLLKIKGLFDIILSNDNAQAILSKIRNLDENSLVNGYVTVTKNKGQANQILVQEDIKNLLTDSGRDFFHAQDYTNTSAGTKGGNAIAVSDDAADPAAGDTALVGEITTGGLTRVEATSIVHSAGTNVTTLENTFTATAIFTALHKSALFNQNTIGGQITHSAAFVADVNLQVSDTLTITWTLTLG